MHESAGRAGQPIWVSAALAVGLTMAAEALIEIAEYPLLYGGSADSASYYDTVADLANTLVGALVGAGLAARLGRRRA